MVFCQVVSLFAGGRPSASVCVHAGSDRVIECRPVSPTPWTGRHDVTLAGMRWHWVSDVGTARAASAVRCRPVSSGAFLLCADDHSMVPEGTIPLSRASSLRDREGPIRQETGRGSHHNRNSITAGRDPAISCAGADRHSATCARVRVGERRAGGSRAGRRARTGRRGAT